jgi:hypothetical protein
MQMSGAVINYSCPFNRYSASRMPSGATLQNSSAVSHNNYPVTNSNHPNGYHASGSSVGRYDAYAPPRRPIASAPMGPSTGQRPGITSCICVCLCTASNHIKQVSDSSHLPFYALIKQSRLSWNAQVFRIVFFLQCTLLSCSYLESTSGSDRRQQTVTFTLNSDQLDKLKSTT